MKKSKLSIGLVTSFIGVLALTACGEIKPDADAIVTFKGYDGEVVKVLTNQVYDDYRDSSNGLLPYYNAIYDTLVRYQYTQDAFRSVYKTLKTYDEVVNLADNKVKADKATAEQNAGNSSYQEEWNKILESHGCKDEAELKEYYILSIEKDEISDAYFETTKGDLEKEYIGVDDSGDERKSTVSDKAASQFPYSVRHILVNVAGSSTNFIQSTITRDEIIKLYTVINKLTDDEFGYLFSEVAKGESQDTSSGASGGDVGIMTPSTSFVNEFKLGVFAYDAILSGVNTQTEKNQDIYDGLGLNDLIENSVDPENPKTVGESLTDEYLSQVPIAIFDKIYQVKDETKDAKGNDVNDGKEAYFPRNIIFNQFLNIHNPFVITNEDYEVVEGTVWKAPDKMKNSTRFINMSSIGKKVLCDELGRPIIGVRGQYGIHFIVMEKSIFENTNVISKENITIKNLTDTEKENTVKKYSTTLVNFYGTAIPSDTNFPKFTPVDSETKQDQITFVNCNEKNITKEAATTRSNQVKDAVKGFDGNYEYRVYEALTKDLNITYQGNLKEEISKYIANQRATSLTSSTKSLNDSWRTYIELLEEQTIERDNGKATNQLVPSVCAVSFSTHSGADWQEGGKCYYEK